MKRAEPIMRWSATVVSAACVVAWVFSLGWVAGYTSYTGTPGTKWQVAVACGCANFRTVEQPHRIRRGWIIAKSDIGLIWAPLWSSGTSGFDICIPLWIIVTPCGAISGVLWLRKARSRPAWQCSKCGYDLRGISTDICPECGKEPRA